ncbi:MAG TPA: gamma-glutamyl-gamma-aminobutyrate hydrolase family protein [Verrucomicrobiae bacterium]|nr:gamma-glutamyl-gamma-aminobutyrate hydrolase family protein [Verrucomicrobiae bacterium]
MSAAPLILISPSVEQKGVEFEDTSLSLSNRYPESVVAGGGLPWVMPCLPDKQLIAECVSRCDGVMLTGGDDLQPGLYAPDMPEHLRKTIGQTSPERDLLETLILDEVFRQHKPLLAICRGHQLLNVTLGGKLIVDIPTERPGALGHSRLDMKDKVVHDTTLAPDSRLAAVLGKTTLGVNSSHHQAVATIAPPLRVTATSPDGIIEAAELKPSESGLLPYLVSVQFHPERMIRNFPEYLPLFRDFVQACVVARVPAR